MNEKTANGPIGAADAHHPVRKASDYVDDIAVEIATYKARLPELLAHEGEYVLIKGDEVIGFFKTSRAAVRGGADAASVSSQYWSRRSRRSNR